MSGFDGNLYLNEENKTTLVDYQTKGYVSSMESLKMNDRVMVLIGYENG